MKECDGGQKGRAATEDTDGEQRRWLVTEVAMEEPDGRWRWCTVWEGSDERLRRRTELEDSDGGQ